MKKIFILTLLCTIFSRLKAQFTGTSTITCTGCIVGLSTTSPQATLDLGGGATQTNYHYPLFWYDDNFSGPYYGTKGGIYLDQWGLANNTTFSFGTASSAPGTLIFASKETSVNDASALTARMTISGQNGYVGIGTTSPNAKLDIFNNSGGATNLILSADYNNMYRWRFNTIDRGNAIDMDITASNSGDQQEAVLQLSTTFSGRPQFALENNWLVAQNGNIGIGTTDNVSWQLAN